MSDLDDGQPDRRIGNHERDGAVTALRAHLTAGRLDSGEYEDRSIKARQARTRADLAQLFADLPQPWPQWDDIATPVPLSQNPAPSSDEVPASQNPSSPESAVGRRGGLLPEPLASWVMALTPFAALLLFFITGYRWQWFLIIPIVGLITYGPDGRHGDRHRNRRRYR